MDPEAPIPAAFHARPCADVARDLLGRWLRLGEVVVRITETEAYLGPHDTACHTARGRTARNAAMWGPLGHAYVYRCYGLHWMLNVVCGPAEGSGAAVLLRSAEVVRGADVVAGRRGGRSGPDALAGPGKLAQGLALDRSFDGWDLCGGEGLVLLAGTPAMAVLAGPRVGVDYAAPADRDAWLRFAEAQQAAVSHRRGLSAEGLSSPGDGGRP